MKRKNAFTLIELMVVVAIIAILATLGVGNYTRAVRKGRDAKRMSDVASIQQALVLYRADFGKYPGSLSSLASEKYMANVPQDRRGNDIVDYLYTPLSGDLAFCLCVKDVLEIPGSGNANGNDCSGYPAKDGNYFCLKNP